MDHNNSSPQIFEADYYQKLYEIEENHWWQMGLRDAMDALFHKALAGRQNLRVLDVGCGTGYILNHLKQYNLSGEVVGLDYSIHALNFCRRRGANEIVLGSAVTLPFRPNTFDLIICIDTLQHLFPAGADQQTLDTIARLLRPDGYFFLRTNSALGHKPLVGVDKEQYRRYTKYSLSKMAEQSGLQVERVSYLNMLPSFWGWFKEYTTANQPKTKAIGPGLSIRMPNSTLVNNLMLTILKIEAFVIGRLGIDLPFGHSLALLAQKVS
jgi:ubiquinone/menaquinone biosynthesis C-methylase UbiE